MTRLTALAVGLIAFFLVPADSFQPYAAADSGNGQLETLRHAERLSEEKKWAEAAAAWQRVVGANPYLGRAWSELGTAYYEAKEYRQAIPAFAKAMELRAGYPFNAAYNIACCHALLGEKEQALDWLQKALDMGFRRLKHV